MCPATSRERPLVVLDDVDAAQERLHRQPAGVPGAAAGGQHVVGAGAVVAQGHRRPGADEDRAGVADPRGHLAGVPRLDLQVLGGVGVDHAQPGVEVVDQHDAGLACRRAPSVIRSECLVAATWPGTSSRTASASASLVVTSTRRPAGRARPG